MYRMKVEVLPARTIMRRRVAGKLMFGRRYVCLVILRFLSGVLFPRGLDMGGLLWRGYDRKVQFGLLFDVWLLSFG